MEMGLKETLFCLSASWKERKEKGSGCRTFFVDLLPPLLLIGLKGDGIKGDVFLLIAFLLARETRTREKEERMKGKRVLRQWVIEERGGVRLMV